MPVMRESRAMPPWPSFSAMSPSTLRACFSSSPDKARFNFRCSIASPLRGRVTQASQSHFHFSLAMPPVDHATIRGSRNDQVKKAQPLTLLDVPEDAIVLAASLIAGGGLPPKARVDSLHVGMAAVHGMDYLLTWNCKHIANASLRGRIEELCREAGFEPPVICTPLELAKE